MTLAPPSATGPADLPSRLPVTGERPGPSEISDRPAIGDPVPVRLGPAAAGRCRRRVHLDADPLAARALRAAVGDGVRLRLADGTAHRDQILATARLTLAGCDGARWDAGSDVPAPVVLEPVLRSRTRFGSPDLLLWAGDGYQPVIVRAHRTTDPGSGAVTSELATPLAVGSDSRRKPRSHPADALALAHHYRLLQELGLASSVAVGGVIGRGGGRSEPGASGPSDAAGASTPDDSTTILWHRLDLPDGSGSTVLADYDRRFADRLAVATAAANGRPALAAPSRIGECRRCAWWPVCSAELTAAQDISLVAAGDDVEVLHAAGIRTAGQLATSDPAVIAALPLTSLTAATARVRARAWLGGIPLVRTVAAVAVPRADLELDVDMESFLEDGAYLWGTYLSGPAVERLGLTCGYRGFVTWRPLPDPDEGRAFAEFWAYLAGLRTLAADQGLTFAAYCYSRSAEERWLRSTPLRYPQVAGMPAAAEIAAFCSSPEWVDIYQQIKDQFVVPGSMKLKSLAPVAGFHWRDPDPGGENSMAWYRDAVGPAAVCRSAAAGPSGDARTDAGPLDRDSAERILRYNEDDVLATLALRRWLTYSAHEVPSVAELDAD